MEVSLHLRLRRNEELSLKTIFHVFAIILFPLTLVRAAWSTDCPVGSPRTTVFYVNGVDNDYEVATISKALLEKEFTDFITKTPPSIPGFLPGCLKFNLAWNPTLGRLLDFYRAARQKLNENPTLIWRFRLNLISGLLFTFVDPITQLYIDTVKPGDFRSEFDKAVLDEHVQKYRAELLNNGNRVVAVAHSGGNFFANQAFDALFHPTDDSAPIATKSFGIIAVATPASFVSGDGPWTTLHEDLLIQLVRQLAPTPPLPANTANDELSLDEFSHSFIGAYLHGLNSRTAIMLQIIGVILDLEPPVSFLNLPTNLTQFKSDGVTGIPLGGTTDESTVVMQGGASDPDGDMVQLEVEVRQVGIGFLNEPNCVSGPAVASGGTAMATCQGLVDGPYHWQARTKDSTGAVSGWLSAGGNLESEADFVVATQVPNNPPTIISLNVDPDPDFIPVGRPVSFSINASDPDGDNLSCDWTTTCGALSATTECGDKTFTAPDTPGLCIVSVVVADPFSASDAASVGINVIPTAEDTRFLCLLEGNPGIPGDGVVVRGIRNFSTQTRFLISPPVSLSGVTNGLTISAFPPTNGNVVFATFRHPLLPPCFITSGGLTRIPPSVNGIQGSSVVFRQSDLNSLVSSIRGNSQCAQITLDQLVIDSVFLPRMSGMSTFDLDALAIGVGENTFPTSTTPPPVCIPPSVTIEGFVRPETGELPSGVLVDSITVNLSDAGSQRDTIATTRPNNTGFYRLTSPPGVYNLRASKGVGLNCALIGDVGPINASAGQTINQDIEVALICVE